MQRKLLLDSTDKVVQFVKLSQMTDCDVDVICDNKIYVDAKSIMGVMSCLNKMPAMLSITGDKDDMETYVSTVSEYLVS